MPHHNIPDWFGNLDEIIAEPLKFKAKLHIGEDAYTSLRLKKSLGEIWDIIGIAGTGASIAKSAYIANIFFQASGPLAWIGIGASATPVGWVVASAIASAGAWYGLTRYLKKQSNDKTIVIPTFINTPLDALALMLFDLMAPLALKVAAIDGEVHDSEREYIKRYFVNDWGYDKDFIDEGLAFIENRLSDVSIKGLAKALAAYQKENRDCNFEAMAYEINIFLSHVMEADGKIDEREEMAIERVNHIFTETGKLMFSDIFSFPYSRNGNAGKATGQDTLDESDILVRRLLNATHSELAQMREVLKLESSANTHEIANEYRMLAGNTIVNLTRWVGVKQNLTYQEILVTVIESLRPVGEDIQIYVSKIKTLFNWHRSTSPPLEDQRQGHAVIGDLEAILFEMVKESDAQQGKLVNATIELIKIGERLSVI